MSLQTQGAMSAEIDGAGLDAAIAEVHYEAGRAHLEKREFKEALAELGIAVKLNPMHGRPMTGLASLGLREVRFNKPSRLRAIATKTGLQKPTAFLVTPFARQEAKGAPCGRLGKPILIAQWWRTTRPERSRYC